MQISKSTKILTQVSILIVLAVVIRALPIPPIPPFGRITFTLADIFLQIIPIIFGLATGIFSAAIIDLLAVFARGEVFMPHFFALAIINAGLVGVLWRYVKTKNRYAKLLIVILITDVIYAPLNLWGLMVFTNFLPGDTVFWVALVPRLGMAIFLSFVKVHIMIVLLTIYEKYIKKEKI